MFHIYLNSQEGTIQNTIFLESAAINSADFPSIQFKELFLNTQRPKVQKGVVVMDIVAEKILKPTAESVNMLYEYIDGDT